ncbi:hypothetical protein [Nocardia fluminea]|uniref:hypothetical protein n=1 Tax=Nocardia fluminea TaxID=134984 RepID=UPI0036677526
MVIDTAAAAFRPGATPHWRAPDPNLVRLPAVARREQSELAEIITVEYGVVSDVLDEVTCGQEVVEFVCRILHLFKSAFSAQYAASVVMF